MKLFIPLGFALVVCFAATADCKPSARLARAVAAAKAGAAKPKATAAKPNAAASAVPAIDISQTMMMAIPGCLTGPTPTNPSLATFCASIKEMMTLSQDPNPTANKGKMITVCSKALTALAAATSTPKANSDKIKANVMNALKAASNPDASTMMSLMSSNAKLLGTGTAQSNANVVKVLSTLAPGGMPVVNAADMSKLMGSAGQVTDAASLQKALSGIKGVDTNALMKQIGQGGGTFDPNALMKAMG